MSRRCVLLPVPVLVLVLLAWAFPGLPAEGQMPRAERQEVDADKADNACRDKLAQRVTVEFTEAPLREALAFLGTTYKMTILVDGEAFKEDLMIQEVEAQPVKLPKLTDVKLSTVLKQLLRQVQGGYVIRDDYLEITPANRASLDQPWVSLTVEAKPLDEALRTVADMTGASVVVDGRAGDKAQAPVSGTFKNVAAETVVRLLAESAGLKLVTIDKVFFVTTAENAKALRQEEWERP